MAKVRVSTLAKEFGMTSKELMGHLAEMKIPAKSASSALEDAYVAMVRKQLASVIEARATDIAEFVQQEIKDSGYAGKLAYGIVLTGGSAKLKDLDELFRRVTGMDVRVAVPETGITGESKEKVADAAFSTAVGILLRGSSFRAAPAFHAAAARSGRVQGSAAACCPALYASRAGFGTRFRGAGRSRSGRTAGRRACRRAAGDRTEAQPQLGCDLPEDLRQNQ